MWQQASDAWKSEPNDATLPCRGSKLTLTGAHPCCEAGVAPATPLAGHCANNTTLTLFANRPNTCCSRWSRTSHAPHRTSHPAPSRKPSRTKKSPPNLTKLPQHGLKFRLTIATPPHDDKTRPTHRNFLALTQKNPQTVKMAHESVWNSRPRTYGKGSRAW
jgi:hypothetical protein